MHVSCPAPSEEEFEGLLMVLELLDSSLLDLIAFLL
jgi:hypothetical protein